MVGTKSRPGDGCDLCPNHYKMRRILAGGLLHARYNQVPVPVPNCVRCSPNDIKSEPPQDDVSAGEVDDNVWKADMIHSLTQFFKDNRYTDVSIQTSKGPIKAHKIILAAASPYFATILTSRWKESYSAEIDLSDCDPDGLSLMIDYIYSGKVKLTQDNVNAVLYASDYFQISSLKHICARYLREHVNETNCLYIYELSKRHSCLNLKDYAYKFALQRFTTVLTQESIPDLQPETLLDILKEDVINIESEDELFEAILKWTNDDESRKGWSHKLLKSIFVDGLTTENQLQFHKEIEKLNNEDDIINEHIPRSRYRREIEVVVVCGGESSGRILENIEAYDKGEGWKCSVIKEIQRPDGSDYWNIHDKKIVLPPLLHPRLYGTIVNKDNVLYITGGMDSTKFLKSAETYSISQNKFNVLPPLPLEVHGCDSAIFNDQVWVVGGMNSNSDGTNTFALDENGKKWVSMPCLTKGRTHLGVASMGNNLYAVGGLIVDKNNFSVQEATNFCEKFDPETKTWKPMASLHHRRAYHCLVVVGDYLYAIGGYNGNLQWLSSMEKYDPFKNQWIIAPSMIVARSSFGATVRYNNIYCMGGFSGTSVLNCAERFNPSTNVWHGITPMQIKRSGFMASTLTLPRERIVSQTMKHKLYLERAESADIGFESDEE